MNDFNFLSVLNVIKYLTVTLVMGCILVMYKTIVGDNFVSYLFIITMIIYFIYTIIKFLIKDKKDINDWFKNTIGIMLNVYIFLILVKEYSLANSIVYSINDTYFMINYVVIVVVTMVLMFSDLLKQKNIKNKWYFLFFTYRILLIYIRHIVV